MVELWTSRGLDLSTATDVIEKISKHEAFFADIMMKVKEQMCPRSSLSSHTHTSFNIFVMRISLLYPFSFFRMS
jgi:hypothetical protein